MSSSSAYKDSFERVFSRQDLRSGASRRAILWSIAGSFFLVATLFVIFLIVDLLETRGRLLLAYNAGATQAENRTAALAELALVEEAIGTPVFETLAVQHFAAAPSASGKTAGVAYEIEIVNSGVLPTIWRLRDRWWATPALKLYQRTAALRYNRTALVVLVLCGVFVGFLRNLLSTIARRQRTEAALGVAKRLRKTIHRQRLRLGPGDLLDRDGQAVQKIFTQDVDSIANTVALRILRFGRYPFELVLLLILAVSIHWRAAVQAVIPLAFAWYFLQQQRSKREDQRKQDVARSDEELRRLSDSLQKTRLIRGYGMETFESERFEVNLGRFNTDLRNLERRDRRSRWLARLIVIGVISVVMILVGFKILEVNESQYGLRFSAALVLLGVFTWMYRPLNELAAAKRDRRDAAVVADRVYRYLDRVPEVGQAVGAKLLQPLDRSIAFEAVTYRLPNHGLVLDGLDLKIPAKGSVALVSLDRLETRALAYLLPRFIEPQKGRVLFDGEDIAWVTLDSLREETVYVGGADPFLTGTVRENICCGRDDYTLQDATGAAKLVHANKLILDLPQGYETVIGEHGEQLDTGQAFRLGLARAALRKAAVIIIEEPEETFDEDTKALLDDAYSRLSQQATLIFLPSRLSTIKRADRVVLLHQGRVEAIGSHFELVKNSQLYRHWEYVCFNAIGRAARG